MFLLDHASITVTSLERSKPFYQAIMAVLGAETVYDRPDALGFGTRCNAAEDLHTCLAVLTSKTAGGGPRRHWCFKADTRARVRAFHQAGLVAGGADEEEPGIRPQYHAHYFSAFLQDPGGNKVEAVCHLA